MKRFGIKREAGGERRYGSGSLGKVVGLATRLQMRHEDTLSVEEVEAIGEKLDLEPAFIREAIAQLERENPAAFHRAAQGADPVIAAFGLALMWGVISYIGKGNPSLLTLCALIVPIPLSVLIGYLCQKKEIAALATAVLILVMMPAVWPFSIPYLIAGYLIARRLGEQGVLLREHLVTVPSESGSVSREALLAQIFYLQQRLESNKAHRAFLNVDVVGSSELAHNGPELAVEHSFNELRKWVETVVRRHAGEVQGTAGDGFMCLFSEDGAAVRAALQLQQEIAQFNAFQNRLPQPFRIRCGLSAGEVAIDEGTPIREVQNPVVYRAAVMQKRAEPGGIVVSREMESVAQAELGGLAPVRELPDDSAALSWIPPQRPLDFQGNR